MMYRSLCAFPIFVLLLISPTVYAQSIQESDIVIYRDGFAHVSTVVASEETSASITIPLLTPDVSNILVYDESGESLDYDISFSTNGSVRVANIEIYSLGATSVRLEYDTSSLTSKLGNLWTFAVNAPFEFSLYLPENSTVTYLNVPPKSIATEGQKIKIEFYPGYCEVSYEILPQTQPKPPTTAEQPLIWYVLAGIVLAGVLLLVFIKMRKTKVAESLKEDERRVIEFIKKNGNRVLEAELREAFPEIPRTSMWRLLKRLE
ncbi:MAG: LPXTG cell wall anchor domain-containing protein, partial [Candidatus Methanomethylicaceae archaeon]